MNPQPEPIPFRPVISPAISFDHRKQETLLAMLTITTPGTGSALFKVTSPNLSAIGLPQGAIVLHSVQPLSPGCLALAQKAGRSILGILLAQSPDLLYQPGLLIRMDDTWTLHAVEVQPPGVTLPG